MTGLSRADLQTIAGRTGRKVVAAWSDRNAGAMGTIVGVVLHHTGSAWSAAGVAPTLQIVREGRSDLQNALCTFYIDKAGTIYLVTEKVAWHAGQGAYRGITDGNGHFLGIEAESDGVHWTTETVDAYVALVAEICRYLGADVGTWAIRHATWATPPGRKTDFAGLNEADFKARVTARLNGTEDTFMGITFNTLDEFQDAVNRAVLCRTPSDRSGSWLWDKAASIDANTAAVHDKILAATTAPAAPTAGKIDLYAHVLNNESLLAALASDVAALKAASASADTGGAAVDYDRIINGVIEGLTKLHLAP